MKGTIFLYGPPGSGKSTLGRRLAAAIGASFEDTDALVERSSGMTIPDIFAKFGEPDFRKRESEALRKAAGSADVVALGGGTLLDGSNRAFCEDNGAVICLDSPDAAELKRRLELNPGGRPLGDRSRERAAHYASFEHRVSGSIDLGDSLVVAGSGIAGLFTIPGRTVFDGNVAAAYPDISASMLMELVPGERNKNIQAVESMWHAFARAGIGRLDRVASCGGGVTGDLVGFAAATWMRGIDWVNIPTTLLAMVDASTGGKTGCDLEEGKNLAGAFHSPVLVVMDTDFLATLPGRELRSGMAEMIKHCVISKADLPASGGLPTASELLANLRVKTDIVSKDPYERNGLRMLLNCGHTAGHAVEKLTGYAVSHGEAVAIGCVEEARLAVRLDLAPESWPNELAEMFSRSGLGTSLPDGIGWDDMVPVMRGDKKRRGGRVVFALPCGFGDVRTVEVDL
ncbi:MAG: bifunctional shikimate kinase/3-dehydroquinate synthase [Victivallaceae bacterium]|nr:bifunctional shikimate kinase/3-dehydroquinate synthase [Victivallaceae bacterium]